MAEVVKRDGAGWDGRWEARKNEGATTATKRLGRKGCIVLEKRGVQVARDLTLSDILVPIFMVY